MSFSILKNRYSQVILAILLGCLLGTSAAINPNIFPFILMGLVYFLIVLAIPLDFVLILIVTTIFIDVSPLTLAGSYIRISQAIFSVYLLKYLFEATKNKFSIGLPLWKSLFLWYTTFFLSIPNMISWDDFYVILTGQAYLYLLYFITYNHFSSLDYKKQVNIIKYYFIGCIAIVLIGILETPLIQVGLIQGYDRGIGILSPSSLLREPDWYGLTCMYTALILFTFSVYKKSVFSNRKTNFFFILSCLGMILSMTRAAWVGFIIGTLFLFLIMDVKRKIKFVKITALITFISIFSFFIFTLISPDKSQTIIDRINPYTSTINDNGAANSRLASINIMLYFINLHPWIGNGVGGMAKVGTMTTLVRQYIDGNINAGRGNANLFLTSLFDSGIIGTFFLVLFIFLYFGIMLKRYKVTKDVIILAFLVSFTGVLADFMFNNGIRFGFFWVHLGLSLAYRYKESLLSIKDNINHKLKSSL